MDRMDELSYNLQLTIYNLHGLWAPAHSKSFVVKKTLRRRIGGQVAGHENRQVGVFFRQEVLH